MHLRKGEQQMKNFFFGISALALLLVGCDDGSADPNDVVSAKPDATAASRPDATEPTTIPTSYPAPVLTPTGFHCPIPASTVNPTIPTAPRNMYRYLINADQFSCSVSGTAGPTDCKSPANGFALAKSDPWCCLNTQPIPVSVGGNLKSAPSAYLLSPSLLCPTYIGGNETPWGQIALCSPEGKFVGWDCNMM